MGLPRWLSGKEFTRQCRRFGINPWVRKIPWRRKWQSTLIFLPGKIPRTEEPGRLQSMGSQKSRTQLSDETTTKLPYGPVIPLPGVYPEKTNIQKDTCTQMFIVALFTIPRTWKQPKCPSTEEQIKKMCVGGVYIKWNIIQTLKEWNNSICCNMDGPTYCHTEWIQIEKKKYHMISLMG